LRSSGIELEEIEEIDYGKTGLTADTVEALVATAGSVAAVLNTRHATAKANGWATAPPSAAEFAKAVVKDVNLLRRPILIDGKTIIIGFDRVRYAALGKVTAKGGRRAP
jgi:arsenate reductase-like glutaredoxin family protein